MFFFGTKNSKIKRGQISNVTCPNCKEVTTLTFTVFGKYVHFYWVPMFPLRKKTIVECNSCYRTYNIKEAPEPVKHKFQREMTGIKTPLWYYSGLAILACLIYLAFYLSKKDEINDANYIQEPKVGDMYTIEAAKKGYYTTMKVNRVTKDSIFVIRNDFDLFRRSNIYRINKDENYTTKIDSFSKTELQHLFNNGNIFEVDRK
ncbi:zinc-ribbon domain-containing protein [Lacinutrix cladophorae]